MSKPASLNYQAEYPVETITPAVVDSAALPAHMRGDPDFDYKPSKDKLDEMKGLAPSPKFGTKDRVPREGVRMPKANSDGVFKDYISGTETLAIREARQSVIVELAKRIWLDDQKYREAYKEAKRVVEEASPEQLENPDRKLNDATKLLQGRKPFSKKEALEKAEQQIYADN